MDNRNAHTLAGGSDNKLNIRLPKGSSASYIPGSYYNGGGAGNDGDVTVSSQDDDGWVSVSVSFPRTASTDVADEFVKECGGSDHVFSPDAASGTTRPSQLNLFLGLKISFAFATENSVVASANVYFGQGHKASDNNWWIGCSNLNQDNLSHDQARLIIENNVPCTAVNQVSILIMEYSAGGPGFGQDYSFLFFLEKYILGTPPAV